ncbi:M3 family metallopeptidase [Amnibacterium kyonggiense]
MTENPFLQRSPLPAALPPFADIRDEHYEPAFEIGMREQREAVARIEGDAAPATFANTLEALELSGPVLGRVAAAFFTLASSHATPFVRALEERIAPRLAAHGDAIRLSSTLFARIDAVWRDRAALDAEQRRLVERTRTEMLLAGAALDDAAKDELRALNERLSALSTRFDAALVADTNDLAVLVTDAAELDGLAADTVSAARGAASARGLEGWLLTLVLPTGQPALADLTSATTRARLMAASRARGSRGGEHDTRAILLETVRLRARRARLLGFPDHAALVAADETAGSTAAVAALLDPLVPAAVRNAVREQADLGGDVDAADWAFRAQARRREQYDVDLAALRPWFEAERVLQDGVFATARRLYGVTFTERADLVGYHPDVRVFAAADEHGPLGLYLLDLYTRDEKRGGAWMNSLVDRASLTGEAQAVVINNLNVPKPDPGTPTLLTLDSVETLFHEFGHALHGLFADVRYPKLAGTNVARDFVEFPSQVNEMWVLHPDVLPRYARHVDTGEPLPSDVADRLRATGTDGQGFATTEYLAATVLDQAWHRLSVEDADAVTDVTAFESEALRAAGIDLPAVPPRYASTYFAHVFAGGYSAAYYAYIWSEVLDADTVAWFDEHGGLTRENGDRFRRLVLARGNAEDPIGAYRAFRGRDADIAPLLERRGLH